ncbi:MAG: hypothetical protein A3E85_00285 [Gammaproteobacteria bacterium RIFCSPHIGHO2_12_FULL_45_12]|nr:MAG: hypothetical protein A3E85_00285 [Gammaproteobacteria bacterium RIFCSPHIGHO2_12_FULL_45_12]
MKKILQCFSVLSLVVGLLSACTTAIAPSDAYRDETAHQIYQKGKTALQDKNFSEAIKRFEALDVQYPFGVETEQAQYYLIYAYYMKEDYVLSASAAERFIRLHPANPHVDYAYYLRALSEYYQNMGILERMFSADLATRDLTQIEKSYRDFSLLVARFPNSAYRPAAHQYMIYLRNILANHELEVAQFYYRHKAYVAAANRASNVVAYYEGAPAVKPALILMAKAYRQLRMDKLLQDTLRVINDNYPDEVVS